ncbi:alpha-glucuronidase family glycosyl hydrolase [Paenibacillus contaminans]|uniref:Alpha glucuronidase N-terminal domain-containing protein n=1 Tax=Paenibacillus contaminans TaxID=450362 RepID=A0A329MUR8_9BACL|nr:alpha-glucuronidase family glycosyl hydrolase [Paenibacillus contaminans]RAV23310.1 hypothetical protein DQG23_03715 [Paenibacillus contaminans]
MTYSIVIGSEAAKLEWKAAQMFAVRSRHRSGIDVSVHKESEQIAAAGSISIIAGTPESCARIGELCAEGELRLPADLGEEGFIIKGGSDKPVYVAAHTPRGVLYGIGKLLRLLTFSAGSIHVPYLDIVSRPDKFVRGIYFATHFGNWYCQAELEAVREYLEELALWGINELLVWFDISHYSSLEEGQPMLSRLARFEAFARDVGMRVGRIAIANEGFKGQVGAGRSMLSKNCFDETDFHPLRARDREFGGYDTDICPSQAAGRDMILSNKDHILAPMPPIDSLWLWPYDQGGCNCPKCTPWPVTFMELNREIASIGARHLPGMTVNVSAWWFDGHQTGEDTAFFKFLEEDSEREQSWFNYIMAGAAEAKRWKQEGRVIPSRHPVVLFPEISMFDGVPWGGKGGNPAPRRFAAEYAELRDRIVGAFPYSEGIYEDMNKVIWSQFMWYGEEEIERIVQEYCRYYFGAGTERQAERFIYRLEDLVIGAETGGAAERLVTQAEEIGGQMEEWARQSWRWKLLDARCRIQANVDRLKRDGDNTESREQFRRAYEMVQNELNLHRGGVSLEPWVYAPSDTALNIFLGLDDVVNLTADRQTDNAAAGGNN